MNSSEIITNRDGSIYHLSLKPEQISCDIILVGDPFRVDEVSKFMNDIEFTIQNREFRSVTGYYNKKRISVISTGIGGSNIDIVINEIDALVNYDFEKNQYRENHKQINFIRIGTSGSISKNIPINSFLISKYAIDLNSQLSFYDLNNYKNDKIFKLPYDSEKFYYCIESAEVLYEKFNSKLIYSGITATCNGFYSFQGRKTRIPLKTLINFDDLDKLSYKNYNVANLEMETAIIYGLANFLNHNAISLNAILANRKHDSYSSDPSSVIESLIKYTLERI